MTKIVFSSNQNGTGTFTIATPVSNTNRTLTLPDVNGSILIDTQIATQEEAIAGTDNTKLMTPLRVAQTVVAVPSGGIILWSGSVASIPAGWALCDGANGTPDLRDRFVVGAGSTYAVGNTGGAATVALSTTNLPAHAHTVNINSGNQSANHTHNFQPLAVLGGGGGLDGRAISGGPPQLGASTWEMLPATTTGVENQTHFHNVNGNTGLTGSGTAHENRPPYYALCYIMNL
jgi:microcystin-dependent protein